MDVRVEIIENISVVHLSGLLDFEMASLFQKNCLAHLGDGGVVFDFLNLEFIGSCGITAFLQALVQFDSQRTEKIKFSGVSSEFKRLIRMHSVGSCEFFETANAAVASYHLPSLPPKPPKEGKKAAR